MNSNGEAQPLKIGPEILDLVSSCITFIDFDGVFIYANAAAARFIGQPASALVGRGTQELFPRVVGSTVIPAMHAVLVDRQPSSFQLRFPGGSAVDGEYAPAPFGAVCVFHDVAPMFRTESELAASKKMLRLVLDTIPLSVFWKNLEGKFIGGNTHFARDHGLTSPDTLPGRTEADLGVSGEDIAEFTAKDLEVIQSGKAVRYPQRTRRFDGKERWHETTKTPLRDGEGQIIGVLGAYEDVTERRAMEEQLRHGQKMEAIGHLAGSVAHDFNNILSAILGYCSLVMSGLPENDGLRTDLTEVMEAAERGARLTRQLLAFGRKQVLSPKVLDLSEQLLGMEGMLQRLVGEDVTLQLALAADVRPVKVDPSQIEQVVLNLAINARDAMPRGGVLTISTDNVHLRDGDSPVLTPGTYAVLSLRDTGEGMTVSTRQRIFEPFFTTKESGRGTGLGLSTVFGIVRQSEGDVTCHSTLGEGTTFCVYFPATDEPIDATATKYSTRPLATGTETVLLVEDQPSVRAVVARSLSRQGYTVLEADNAGEALLIAEDHPGPIHLLFADVILPRLTGPKLAERLRPLRPEMRVLFMSGYLAGATGIPAGDLLLKPFVPEVMLRRVRHVLDRTR